MISKALLCGYALASSFLFLFPKFLHPPHAYASPLFQQALKGTKILNIAHRGAPRAKPENTIASFDAAVGSSDMLEMDVCVSRDGELVVHHDLDLRRTCGVDKLLKDVDAQDLPLLQGEIELQFAEQGRRVATGNQRIPTLRQVFQQFPQTPMNIELKSTSQASIIKLIGLLIEYKRSEFTIVGIRKENHEQLTLLDPKSITFCNDSQILKIILAYFTGLLPFIPLPHHALQIPLYTRHFYEWKHREWKNPIKSFLFFAALRAMNTLMTPLAWHLRRRGVMTFYWVCNSDEEFSRAVSCGASGIITDEPQLLRWFLEARQAGNSGK